MNYDNIINKVVQGIKPSGIRKFFDIVNDMPEAISLGVGEPDFVTPWGIRDFAIKSIQKGYTQYTSNMGLPKLRKEISDYLAYRYDLHYSEKTEIICTVGASEGIDLALRTIIEQGDEVLVPDPSYVSYTPNILLAGGRPVAIPMHMEQEFKIMPEALERAITPRTKALILPYPNNPTGAIMEKEYLAALLPIIIKNNLIIISDEIYSELTYGSTHVSIASLENMRERTIVINGFSKGFAMTGWRLGFVSGPEEIIKPMLKIHQYVIMCAPTASQYAGLFALKMSRADNFLEVQHMRDEYDMRRRFLVNEFNDMGLECFEPKGAFYVFPSVAKLGLSGNDFAEKLLYQEKVAVVPGDAFGESGKNYIRCSYACSMKNLKIACDRIRHFIESLQL